MNEVMTILEAKVEKNNWWILKKSYVDATKNITESVKQTFLIQSQIDDHNWRIVTHWRSQADLDQMRATVKVPVGVRIFKSAGATPHLEIWNSRVHRSAL